MNRSETVERIEELLNGHEECGSCQTCKEVDNLRNKLLYNPKIQTVLDKGKSMTKSDIAFLIGKEVRKEHIARALKMRNTDFKELLINWGLQKGAETEMAKLKTFTQEEYRDLKAQGLNDEEIAEKKNVTSATIYNWKKKSGLIGTTLYKQDTEPKVFKPSITPKEPKQPPKNELQDVVNTLKRQLNVREEAINQQHEKIEHLKATTVSRDKYNNMKIDFEEAELERIKNFEEYKKMEEAYHKEHSIVISLDAELENVREMLRDVRKDYVKAAKENEHLWGLLKIKMEG
jgi:hypothetical protein